MPLLFADARFVWFCSRSRGEVGGNGSSTGTQRPCLCHKQCLKLAEVSRIQEAGLRVGSRVVKSEQRGDWALSFHQCFPVTLHPHTSSESLVFSPLCPSERVVSTLQVTAVPSVTAVRDNVVKVCKFTQQT